MDMRLLGAPTISDLTSDMVDYRNVGAHIVAVPTDRQYDANCPYLLPFISPSGNVVDCIIVDEGMQSARLRDEKSNL